MNNNFIRAITVQHKSVLNMLENNEVYRADINRVCDIRRAAYSLMMQTYGYQSCPIFLAPIGKRVELYGAKFTKDHVAIELNVPIGDVRIQEYYEWADLIYFLEWPDEFAPSIYQSVSDFGKDVLLNTQAMDGRGPYQLSTESLRKDWIVGVLWDLDKLDELHNGSGGNNTLKELSFYV